MNIFNENLKDRILPEKTFGFDIDDVIWDLMSLIISHLNENWDKQFSLDSVTDWDFWGMFEWKWQDYLKNMIIERWMYEKMSVYEDTKEFINNIKDTHQITFVTSRFSYPWILDITKQWFDSNWIYYDSIHFEKFKSYFCKIAWVDYFVDDSLENAIKISKNSKIQVFLLNKPWNQQTEINRLIKNWIFTEEQIKEELSKIKRINNVGELNKDMFNINTKLIEPKENSNKNDMSKKMIWRFGV
jgi:uncharacterized HAD superfamily protein